MEKHVCFDQDLIMERYLAKEFVHIFLNLRILINMSELLHKSNNFLITDSTDSY